jgi:regulator of replication initiation timing
MNLGKIFKQKYHGNLTFVPRFTSTQMIGLQVLGNPSVEDMVNYLHHGQLAAWPYLKCLRYMLRLEIALDEGVERLKSRIQELGPDPDDFDDLESIASCSTVAMSRINRNVRFSMPSRQVESLQKKLASVELENNMLRREVEELRRRLSDSVKSDGSQTPEEKIEDESDGVPSVILNEGNVFNLVRGFMNHK